MQSEQGDSPMAECRGEALDSIFCQELGRHGGTAWWVGWAGSLEGLYLEATHCGWISK